MAVFSAGGAYLGSRAQAEAAEDAAKIQLEMFEQTREDFTPYRLTGVDAMNAMRQLFLPGAFDVEGGTIDFRPAPEEVDIAAIATRSQLESELLELQGQLASGQITNERGQVVANEAARRVNTTRIQRRIGEILQQLPDAPAVAPVAAAGAATEEAPPGPDFSSFFKSPSYQFRLDEGIRALDRSASARGRLGSGAHSRDLVEYGQGLASTEFNNYANRLATLAGYGQTAVGTAGAIGQQAAANAGSFLAEAGAARGSGYVALGQGAGKLFQTAAFAAGGGFGG